MGLRNDLPLLRLVPPPATATNQPAAISATGFSSATDIS